MTTKTLDNNEELARKAAANALEALAFDIGPINFYVEGMTTRQCSELTARFRNLLRNRAEDLNRKSLEVVQK